MGTRLTVGQFSAMTHLSVKMLRHYHDRGLLVPAHVDEYSGYRYYDPTQISPAQTIRRLRDLDMPLDEIAGMVGDTDRRRRNELLTAHLRRVEQRLAQTQDTVAALRRLLDQREPAGHTIERRLVPPTSVVAVSAVVEQSDILAWYASAMAEIDQLMADACCTANGPAGAVIDNSIITHGRGELTVYLPVDTPPTAGRARAMTLPQTELAVMVHSGNHTDIDITYGLLAQWALNHGLEPTGPVHENYLVGPRDTPQPHAWRTEIGWPVTHGDKPDPPARTRV